MKSVRTLLVIIMGLALMGCAANRGLQTFWNGQPWLRHFSAVYQGKDLTVTALAQCQFSNGNSRIAAISTDGKPIGQAVWLAGEPVVRTTAGMETVMRNLAKAAYAVAKKERNQFIGSTDWDVVSAGDGYIVTLQEAGITVTIRYTDGK